MNTVTKQDRNNWGERDRMMTGIGIGEIKSTVVMGGGVVTTLMPLFCSASWG
jgi:hypothetical protein